MSNDDKKQSIAITMLSVGLVVLLGVVCWQQVMIAKQMAITGAIFEKKEQRNKIIYRDPSLGFQARTSQECADYFEVKTGSPLAGTGHNKALANLKLYIKGFDEKVWPANSPVGFFAVFTQADYLKIPDNQLPGVPRILEVLNGDAENGYEYLTAYPIQDYPQDPKLQNCKVIWERDSEKN